MGRPAASTEMGGRTVQFVYRAEDGRTRVVKAGSWQEAASVARRVLPGARPLGAVHPDLVSVVVVRRFESRAAFRAFRDGAWAVVERAREGAAK